MRGIRYARTRTLEAPERALPKWRPERGADACRPLLLLLLLPPLLLLLRMAYTSSPQALLPPAQPAPLGLAHRPTPAPALPSTSAAQDAARLATAQCGELPYSDAMPLNTVYGGTLAPPFSPSTCPGIEAALRAAVREAPATPLSARAFQDGKADGALTLPANCSLRWFPPSEACSLMPSMLVLVGDSLSRHLSFALRQVLTGNYAAGHLAGTTVPPDSPEHGLFFPPDFYPLCLCDNAYRICAHLHPPPTAQRWVAVCPNWAGQAHHLPPMHFLSWFGGFMNATHLQLLLGAPAQGLAEARGHPPPALVLEVGPAWGKEGYAVGHPAILSFLEASFESAKATGARVVCYLTLAPNDALKPQEYLASQGVAATRLVNDWVAQECAARGGRVLDAFALTLGAFSRDGTHFQTSAMTLVAQALLNLLAHFPA